jgi:hypothetical protein
VSYNAIYFILSIRNNIFLLNLFIIQMSIANEEMRTLDLENDAIDLQTAPSGDRTNSSDQSEIETSILSWFNQRGILQGNPEDLVHTHQCTLRLCVRSNIRKMSAPDERSFLLNRRFKGNMNISI